MVVRTRRGVREEQNNNNNNMAFMCWFSENKVLLGGYIICFFFEVCVCVCVCICMYLFFSFKHD